MKNKGQTTVFFSCMISVLLLFTLTALEVGRIYMSRVKARAVIHSAQTSILADYHRELFERYHLLYLDPTYATGSEAIAEERYRNYIEESLNGGTGQIYQYDVEEIALAEEVHILEDGMKTLKQQIKEYEKTEGVVKKAEEVWNFTTGQNENVENAKQETERNAQEIEGMKQPDKREMTEEDVTDPRKTLKEATKSGLLSFVLPDHVTISREKMDYSQSPSAAYSGIARVEKDISFADIGKMKNALKESGDMGSSLVTERVAFADYVKEHFSNVVHTREDSVVKCEMEYILVGGNNDYDNVQVVVNDIAWLRMPVNYAYLLSDSAKKSEALTVAAGICTATGTPALMEIVKYLLLGCWAYGESLHEIKLLLAGEKVPYVKNTTNWYTDLKSLVAKGTVPTQTNGMDYESFLMLLLIKEAGKEVTYARMLDMIEKNLQVQMPSFRIGDLIGAGRFQGKITVNAMFVGGKSKELYEIYFDEPFSYTND